MNRPSELFAFAALALLAAGLLFPRLSITSSVLMSVYSRNASYAVQPEAGLFGLAALFALFAFVYSLWIAHLNRTAAEWHFWLSATAIVLLAAGFCALASMPKAAASSSFGGVRTAVASGAFVGVLLFFAGQVVFLTNLVLIAVRANRT